MPTWLRSIGAIIAGIFIAGGCVAAIETLGHQWLQGQGQFMAAALGLGFAALVGGGVALWIGKVTYFPVIIAAVLSVLMLINVFSFQHPVWFVPVALISLAAGVFAAQRLLRPKGATS